MPYPRCPHCGEAQFLDLATYRHFRGPIVCSDCKGRYELHLGDAPGTTFTGYGVGGALLSPPRPLGDPELLKGLSVPALPPALQRDFEDAINSLASGIPRGAALFCRHAIQRALLSRGIPDRPPEEMVNIARNKDILSELAVRQCRAATFMGGKAGHPQADELENIGESDAKQALLVTRRVLLELFNPAGLK